MTKQSDKDAALEQARAFYHVPPATPREEMWEAIVADIRRSREASPVDGSIPDLTRERRARALLRNPAWWALAAAALFVLGLGMGRYAAPGGAPRDLAPVASTPSASGGALLLAAREHLGRSESLLTMVRTDARRGALEPATSEWARGLLAETRLLIDAGPDGDPLMGALLDDLELVLIQIVGVAEGGASLDEARARTELGLALRSLEEGEVLSRIQAAVPGGMLGT